MGGRLDHAHARKAPPRARQPAGPEGESGRKLTPPCTTMTRRSPQMFMIRTLHERIAAESTTASES